MNIVNYIEKTHQYYLRKGYDRAYNYAHNEDGPFRPITKPVSQSRLMMISSAGMEIIPDDGPEPEPFKGINIGEKDKVEVFDIPSNIPKKKLKYITGAHNRAESDMPDIDAFFPITRLRELHTEGAIGSLAENFLRIRPCYSTTKSLKLDAPEVLARCRKENVDVALLVPV